MHANRLYIYILVSQQYLYPSLLGFNCVIPSISCCIYIPMSISASVHYHSPLSPPISSYLPLTFSSPSPLFLITFWYTWSIPSFLPTRKGEKRQRERDKGKEYIDGSIDQPKIKCRWWGKHPSRLKRACNFLWQSIHTYLMIERFIEFIEISIKRSQLICLHTLEFK